MRQLSTIFRDSKSAKPSNLQSKPNEISEWNPVTPSDAAPESLENRMPALPSQQSPLLEHTDSHKTTPSIVQELEQVSQDSQSELGIYLNLLITDIDQ